jgi:hypothetical protein
MKPFVLRYGLRAGAVLVVVMLLVTLPLHDRISNETGMAIGYASMVGAFLFVFAAVRAYRDAQPGGTVSFGRALTVGMLVVGVASVCYTAAWEVAYYSFYRHTFMARYQETELAKLRAKGASPAAVEAKAKEMREFAELYDNPVVNVAFTMLEPLPPGLVMALAAAGLLRRRRDPAAAPALARAG